MKERIEKFLSTVDAPETRDVTELKEIYKEITGKEPNCGSDTCIVKMLTEVRKFYDKLTRDSDQPAPPRKYVLKEGNHTIAPGGHGQHNNDNTSDEDIEELLKYYPHIKQLLIN